MLSGFNTNIRHRGVLFHVQSEDSGRAHPHIITHLYHGGTILASEKSSYADRVEEPDLPAVVKELMERQHKAFLKRLRARAFDAIIVERLGEGVFDDGSESKARTSPVPTETEPTRDGPAPAPTRPDLPPARSFGEGIVSEKPLDEVILNYLVENARKRKQKPS
jgi:hypothetical protein